MNQLGQMDNNNDILSLGPTDLVIPVLGLTGVGKSSFITRLADREAGIGHGLISCMGVYAVEDVGRMVYLVDTPGFNNTHHTDVEIFKELVFLLSQIYQHGARLGGIIYLHRITDNRAAGTAVRSFNTLKTMCGLDAAKFVLLVTTMWDTIPCGSELEAIALNRERELRDTEIFWGQMVRRGSRMVRWPDNMTSPSDILRTLIHTAIRKGPVVLQIQREIVDMKFTMEATTAGRELTEEFDKITEISHQELRKLETQCVRAERSQDCELVKMIQVQKASTEGRIQEAEAMKLSLRERVETLFKRKRQNYKKFYNMTRNEQDCAKGKLERYREECQQLEDDIRRNTEFYNSETQQYHNQLAEPLTLANRKQLDELHRLTKEGYEELQEENSAKLKTMMRKARLEEKRRALKRNAVPILGILAGTAAIAAGAATAQIPVVTVGISIFATAVSKLKVAKKKTKKKEEEYDVQVDI